MLLKDFLPLPENRELVRLLRIIHFEFDKHAPTVVKAYPPRPEHVLSFFPQAFELVDYGHNKFTNLRTVLTGQHDFVFNRAVQGHFLCLQIVFHPTGFFRLTGIPCQDVRNQYLDGETFFGSELRFITEQLHFAKTYEQMLGIANTFVRTLRRKRANSPIDAVSGILLRDDRNVSLDWLADQASLSARQFERNFTMQTGVSPKTFIRVRRFDKAFRTKNQFPQKDWLTIALECGYYDYQHLVRDYREFTGLTPPQFHMLDGKAPERLFGMREGIDDRP